MKLFFSAAILFLFTISLYSAPIELKEVTLMLKHGISSAELVADIKTRKLILKPTPEQLTGLKELGASKELLDAVIAPSNVLGDKESESFLKEKEISGEPHFWVIGDVLTVKDGVMLVLCQDLHQKKQGLDQFVGIAQIRGKLPAMFKATDVAKAWLINCETRRSGIVQMKTETGDLQDVSQLELVQDFGKLEPQNPSPLRPEPPKPHETSLGEGKWYHLSDPQSVAGGGPNVWFYLVGSDQFNLSFKINQGGPQALAPAKRIPIKKGTDANKDNLTLIIEDAYWSFYWKDSSGAFPGTGLFLFEPKP